MSKILKEVHHLKHDTLELQYLDALKYFKEKSLLKHYGTLKLEELSKFNDKSKYAGSTSSSKYLSHVYTAYMSLLRSKMEHETMVLDGSILKGDHSFKVIKHMGKIEGKTVFQGLHTICNEFDEVRSMAFVTTKGHGHLKPALEELKSSYELYGHKMPQIFFTDNVDGDQKLLEEVFPSINVDVRHIGEAPNVEQALLQ